MLLFSFVTSIVLPLIIVLLAIAVVSFVVLPFLLAAITSWRLRSNTTKFQSAMYVGRVWHTRFLPAIHSFTYPLFIFALDLAEIKSLSTKLWPLNTIMAFRESHHLINGEGLVQNDGDENDNKTKEEGKNNTNEKNSLANRIIRLVAEKSNNKLQISLQHHRIVLVTHLSYFGYNFNPVSYYYIIEKAKNDTENESLVAVVEEVSNTPWQEMYCYLLHTDSIDKVTITKQQSEGGDGDGDDDNSSETKQHSASKKNNTIRYIYPKNFHVSPFMEMDYMYDTAFCGFPNNAKDDSLSVVMSLRRQDKAHFTAKFNVSPQRIDNPFQLAWQLVRFPAYCVIIQLWIHYEAFWLFRKGVSYVPHPQGSETAASRIIGGIMTPIFELKDWLDSKKKHHDKQS